MSNRLQGKERQYVLITVNVSKATYMLSMIVMYGSIGMSPNYRCCQGTVQRSKWSITAAQRDSGTVLRVLGRIDRSRNNLSDVSDCSAVCCGIFVTEVKSLISRFTAFGSLIYCVLEMEATQFIFISNKQLFPLSSQ